MPVYKDKNGTWYFKCSIKGVQFLRRGFKTKKEGQQALNLFLIDSSSKSKRMTFYELVKLFKRHKRDSLKPTTYYLYCKMIDKHILSNMPDKFLDDLTYNDFVKFKSRINKSMSSNKNKILNLFISMFDFARSNYGVINSDVHRLTKFKDFSPVRNHDPKIKLVEFDTFKKYYDHANDFFKFYLLTTYIFGLRISEVRGLTLGSIDFDGRLLYINQVTTSKAGLSQSLDLVPKSSSSVRKYYLCDSYFNILINYINTNKLKGNGRLFFSSTSIYKAIGETPIRRYLNSLEKQYELEHITPHGLRHGIASYLFAKGISFDMIGKYLGHRYNNVTMDYYIDLTKDKQKYITKVVDELIKSL